MIYYNQPFNTATSAQLYLPDPKTEKQSGYRGKCTGFLSLLSLILISALTMLHGPDALAEDLSKNDIRHIRDQAVAGDSEAQFSLALLLDHGDREKQDKKEAVYWFTRAAEQNLAGACLYLAIKYEYGSTVKQDLTKAAFWYKKAALQGWPSAQYFLGMLYISGNDIPENKVKAVAWLSMAAEHEYPNAEVEIKSILPLLSEKERKEAKEMTQVYSNAILKFESIE